MKEFDPISSLFLAQVLCDTPPNIESLFLARVWCDNSPMLVDLLYLFGETPDNQNSVLRPAAEIYRRVGTVKVGITGLRGAQFGYPGVATWQMALETQGVRPRDILLVPADEKNANTYTEAVELVRLASEHKLGSIGVMAPAFHLPRCFLSTVSAAKTMGASHLRIYAMVGDPQPWNEKVIHSQGVVTGTRTEIFRGELERISRYQAKGDLISLEEALEYMRERDRGAI